MFHLPIIEMSDIVEGIPDTVETLVLTSLPIETSFDDLCAPNVKEFVLSMCMFDKGMDGLIEAYFPNLTRLIMADGCCISQKKLNMSDLQLNHLEIKDLLYISDLGLFGKRTWNGQDKMNVLIKTSHPKVDKK
jgi:hypothetical protein